MTAGDVQALVDSLCTNPVDPSKAGISTACVAGRPDLALTSATVQALVDSLRFNCVDPTKANVTSAFAGC